MATIPLVTSCLTHHDQFDLVLIARAKIEDLALVSNETLFDDAT